MSAQALKIVREECAKFRKEFQGLLINPGEVNRLEDRLRERIAAECVEIDETTVRELEPKPAAERPTSKSVFEKAAHERHFQVARNYLDGVTIVASDLWFSVGYFLHGPGANPDVQKPWTTDDELRRLKHVTGRK